MNPGKPTGEGLPSTQRQKESKRDGKEESEGEEGRGREGGGGFVVSNELLFAKGI